AARLVRRLGQPPLGPRRRATGSRPGGTAPDAGAEAAGPDGTHDVRLGARRGAARNHHGGGALQPPLAGIPAEGGREAGERAARGVQPFFGGGEGGCGRHPRRRPAGVRETAALGRGGAADALAALAGAAAGRDRWLNRPAWGGILVVTTDPAPRAARPSTSA